MFEYDGGTCSHCGNAWFDLVAPETSPEDVPSPVPAAVCIDDDGMIVGYAGMLRCTDCDQLWDGSHFERPFLRLGGGEDGIEQQSFEAVIGDEFEDPTVVSFTQNSDHFAPEVTASGFDATEWDAAIGMAVRGIVQMALQANGFFVEADPVDEDEDPY